ncbi:MAG: hypothetical protein K2Q22_01820, partial [Cytophagales bacterium]|nr:hypothetical protein [Cytophagales bacterium]
RRRWASKWENYKNNNIKYLSVFVFGVQLAWVILFLLSVSLGGFSYFLIGYMVKTLADGFLIYRLVRWFGFRFHWVAFLTLEVCYPFYVVIFALVGRKKGYFWKGRNLGL